MEHHSAIKAFGLEHARAIAIVGGGGKSSLMAALGKEYHRRGETVIMTTTTHIRPPRENGYMGDDAAVLGSLLASCRLMTVGTMSEDRKFGPSPLLEQLPELAKLRFDLEPDQIVTPELMAMLLSSPLAQRKDVGSRPYAVLLNQADRARPDEIAAMATLLLQKGVERVVTAALQRRPGEYEVWKR